MCARAAHVQVADEHCQLAKPPSQQVCIAQSACQLASGTDCSGNGLCSASAGECICNRGWQVLTLTTTTITHVSLHVPCMP